MPANKRFVAPALLVAMALIWGSSFILIKRGLVAFSADEVATLRIVVAFFFLLPIAVKNLKKLSPSDYVRLFVSGLMGIFIPSFLFASAQTRLDSAVAGIINSLTPVWAIIIGALVYDKGFTKYAIIGTLIGFSGILLLTAASAKGPMEIFNPQALLLVGATFLYGINLNFVKYNIKNVDAPTITSVSIFLVGCLAVVYLFGFTPFTTKLTVQEGALEALAYVVVLGLMSTAIAVMMLNHLIKLSSPLYASFVTYLIPIVAITLGVFDGEQLNKEVYLGMAAVLGGVYLVNKR